MTALPGQRAAQRPLRAMVAAQKVLGRSAQAANGGLVGAIGVAFIGGQQYEVDLSAPPEGRLRPVEPPGSPSGSGAAGGNDGTKQQERQG